MTAATEIPFRRRIDWVSAAMAAITVAALLGAFWFRAVPSKVLRPLVVGDIAPPLHLLDLNTSEPLVLAGLRGKVVWMVFWAADSSSGRSIWAELERASGQLKGHRRFTLVTAAVEADQPGRVRAVVNQIETELPVYLADPETRRRYRAEQADPPLHILIDAEGRVAAIARGAGRQTIERMADLAKRLADELDPLGATRFARAAARSQMITERIMTIPPRNGDPTVLIKNTRQDSARSASSFRPVPT